MEIKKSTSSKSLQYIDISLINIIYQNKCNLTHQRNFRHRSRRRHSNHPQYEHILLHSKKIHMQSTFSPNPINILQIHLHLRAMETIPNSKFQWINIIYVSLGSNPTKIRNIHRLGWRKKKNIVKRSMDHPLIQYDSSRRL